MLGFIQRYQKIIFSVVAVVISVSFLFFGMIPKGASSIPDKVVYQTANHQKIKRSKFEGVRTLITTHNGEYTLFGPALGPHYFSENFFVSDLVKPGLLNLVFQKYLNDFKEDWQENYQKEIAYKPYVHPNASFLNAETIWSIHAPKLEASLGEYKKAKGPLEQFKQKQKIYLEEAKFPSFALWQVLSEQEAQFEWIPKDPNLNPQNLNLFGYQRLEDWVGDTLLKRTCEFIFEVNAVAKEKGYRLTDQEVEQDLMQLNEQNFMRIKSLGIKDFEDSTAYFEQKLRHLGMTKVQMIECWRELLTFRRFFQETGHSALLDSFALASFEGYANKSIKVNRFALPKPLQLNSMQDLMELEVYLEALGKPLNQLSLNFKRKNIDEIAATYPQFVESPLQLQYKEVHVSTAALGIKVQDIWNWKLDPKNKATLLQKFPKLAFADASQDFQDQLENLDPMTTVQMDQFVRELLLKANKDWLNRALSHAEPQEVDLAVRLSGQGLPFENLELSKEKEAFLSKIFQAEDAEKFTAPFSFDDQHYYQIIGLSHLGEKQLVSYEELKKERALEKILNRKIKDSGIADEKSMDLSHHVKLFEPLKREIVKDYLSTHKDTIREFSDEFYCQYRFYSAMRAALDFFKENHREEKAYSFNSLWELQEDLHTHTRYLSPNLALDDLLTLKEGQWTGVEAYEKSLEFSHIVAKPKHSKKHLMQKKIKKQINRELTQAMGREILDQMN